MNNMNPIQELVDGTVKLGIITKSEINFLRSNLENGEFVDLSRFIQSNVYLTIDHASEELDRLRNVFITKHNYKRYRDYGWTEDELRAIGYNGEGNPLIKLECRDLIKFCGFKKIGDHIPDYLPIYSINGVAYFTANREPLILFHTIFNAYQ